MQLTVDSGQLTTEEIEAKLAYLRYGRKGCFAPYVECGLLPRGWLAHAISEVMKDIKLQPEGDDAHAR